MTKKLLFAVLLMCAPVFAQTHKFCPVDSDCSITGNWTFSGGLNLAPVTVGTLPLGVSSGQLAIVTDGTTAADCTIGGSNHVAWCEYNGTGWISLGGSGGSSTPGGSTGAFQYNNAGVFGGSSITGLVKGNGFSAPTAAVAGTDYPGLAFANTWTQPQTGPFRDKGGAVFNVKAYGATGNGVTDDTTAISSAVTALNSAGGGILFFPSGNYLSATCNWTLSVPAMVAGTGQGENDSQAVYGSAITCTNASNPGFTFTGNVGKAQDIALYNTATNPTAAGFVAGGSTSHQRNNLNNVYVWGWLDGAQENGAYWEISGSSQFTNNVRYGIRVANTINPDEGDWSIHDISCVGGSKTNTSSTAGTSSCIAMFSAGGGKIHSIKSNATFTHGIYLNCAACGTSQLLIDQADIENNTNSPIYLTSSPSTFLSVVVAASFLSSPTGFPTVYADHVEGIIQGNKLDSSGTFTEAIQCTTTSMKVGPNVFNSGAFTSMDGQTCANSTGYAGDQLTSTPGTRAGSFYIGCNVAGCLNGEQLNFVESSGTGSIASNYAGAGMTFTLPRTLTGKGFVFANNGATQMFYIDGNTGGVTSKNQTIDDGSGNASVKGNLTLGCLTAGCPGTPTLTMSTNFGGTGFSSSIATSYSGNGMTFTAIRDLATKGFYFNSNGGTTRMWIDSSTGDVTVPTGRVLVTGIVDGLIPITKTSGTTATLGGTYNTGYTFNQNVTSAAAITYTLPTAAAGKQYCVKNSFNGSVADTGALTVQTSAAGQFIISNGTLSATGGFIISAGAAGDALCVVGIDATHWEAYAQSGTWTLH